MLTCSTATKKGLKILTVLFIPDKWQKYATSMELQAEV